MKKRKMLFCTIGIAAFFAMSCVLTPKVTEIFDDTVPLEQTAWICPSAGTITSYNEIPVNWKQTPFSLGVDNITQIPAGDALLEWDLDSLSADNSTKYTGKGILTSFNFKPQKEYFFLVSRENNKYGLNVYEFDFGEKIKMLSFKDLEPYKVGFMPFLNVASGNRVLE